MEDQENQSITNKQEPEVGKNPEEKFSADVKNFVSDNSQVNNIRCEIEPFDFDDQQTEGLEYVSNLSNEDGTIYYGYM